MADKKSASKAHQAQSSKHQGVRAKRRGDNITERNKVFGILKDIKRIDRKAVVSFKNASVLISGPRPLNEHAAALDRIGVKTGIARLKTFIAAYSGDINASVG